MTDGGVNDIMPGFWCHALGLSCFWMTDAKEICHAMSLMSCLEMSCGQGCLGCWFLVPFFILDGELEDGRIELVVGELVGYHRFARGWFLSTLEKVLKFWDIFVSGSKIVLPMYVVNFGVHMFHFVWETPIWHSATILQWWFLFLRKMTIPFHIVD